MTEQTIAGFLKQLRKTSGLSANEVVNKLKSYSIEISAKTLYGYESGLSMLNADVFVALCRIYKCDNPMELFGNISITSHEYEHIEKYRSLDTLGRETVNTVLDCEFERINTINDLKGQNEELKSRTVKRAVTYSNELIAAHERTDIDVTEEMKKHDDDIMNDDSEWE